MRWDLTLAAIVGILLPLLFVLCNPPWQGRFLFGVRVVEELRNLTTARAIVLRFRLISSICAVACTLLLVSGVVLWAPLLSAAGLMAAFQLARMQTWPHAAIAGGTLGGSLLSKTNAEKPAVWWMWAAPALGLAILSCSMAVLFGSYDVLPWRYPVHWNTAGDVDRWATKNFRRVLGPLGVGVAVQLLLAFIVHAMRESSPLMSKRRSRNILAIAILSLALPMMLSLIGLSPLSGAANLTYLQWIPIWLPILLTALALVTVFMLQSSELEEEEATRDECWSGGWWFHDEADSRMMVPSRISSGYTFNFGNRVVRLMVPLTVGILLLSIWLLAGD